MPILSRLFTLCHVGVLQIRSTVAPCAEEKIADTEPEADGSEHNPVCEVNAVSCLPVRQEKGNSDGGGGEHELRRDRTAADAEQDAYML